MQVKVKICGIRSIEAAKAAVDAGADFLGFNFVLNSKRYINPKNAKKIMHQVKGKVLIVGVFQNAVKDYVNEIGSMLNLDFLQLHGTEDNEYINKVGMPVIKSITVEDQPGKIKAEYLLLDRTKRGEGKMVDLIKAADLAQNFPIFLAGGLTPGNVAEAVNAVKPFGVDVAGGVETNGQQDTEKIKLFILRSKRALLIKNAKGVKI